jgi:hypothetical protein
MNFIYQINLHIHLATVQAYHNIVAPDQKYNYYLPHSLFYNKIHVQNTNYIDHMIFTKFIKITAFIHTII